MMRGMFAAISGLKQHQTMLDATANDIANVNTIGYKSSRVTFADSLTQLQRGAAAPGTTNGGSNAAQIGLGVTLGSVDNIMTGGATQTTGNPYDVAIQGEGMFELGQGDVSTNPNLAPTEYTRAGNFTLNSNGYLTTQSGQYVVGATAPSNNSSSTPTYINVPPGSTNVAVGQDGSVTYTDENASSPTFGQTVNAGYISLATFPNDAGLERDGGSLWSATAASGAPTTGTPSVAGFGQTLSGNLEMSNVDMATEFTNMITAERTYQANSKVITTADSMLQTLVNMPQG